MSGKVKRAVALSVAAAVPDNIVTNADLEKMVDTSDEWIVERTGIRERRIAPEGVVTSDLCVEAAREALEKAGITADDLDTIICGTATPDFPFPSLAAILQSRLETSGQMAFDVTAACSGFLFGLSTAEKFITSGHSKYVMVVGAELLSRITNWGQRESCVLFGDGAGVVILGAEEVDEKEGRGILSSVEFTDGSHWPILYQPAGGTRKPPSHETVDNVEHVITMVGNEVYKVAVRTLIEMAQRAVDAAGVTIEDVDLFVPHQANLRIIEAVGKRLGIDPDKVFVNVDKYGNTSAASIPIALAEASEKGMLKRGDLVLLDTFGGGVTSAAVLMRW